MLLDHGAKYNYTDKEGTSPLEAVLSGSWRKSWTMITSVIDLFIQHEQQKSGSCCARLFERMRERHIDTPFRSPNPYDDGTSRRDR